MHVIISIGYVIHISCVVSVLIIISGTYDYKYVNVVLSGLFSSFSSPYFSLHQSMFLSSLSAHLIFVIHLSSLILINVTHAISGMHLFA